MQKPIYEPDNPHATHYPLLEYVANLGNGKFIEAGSGYSSSPLLYKIANDKNGRLISLENNSFFVNKFFGDNNQHFLICDVNWNTFFESPLCKELIKLEWDILFVDSAPFESRLQVINALGNSCKYILLHDCDWFIKTNIVKSWSEYFKYYIKYNVYKKPYITGPPTLLASNKIEKLEFNINGMYIDGV